MIFLFQKHRERLMISKLENLLLLQVKTMLPNRLRSLAFSSTEHCPEIALHCSIADVTVQLSALQAASASGFVPSLCHFTEPQLACLKHQILAFRGIKVNLHWTEGIIVSSRYPATFLRKRVLGLEESESVSSLGHSASLSCRLYLKWSDKCARFPLGKPNVNCLRQLSAVMTPPEKGSQFNLGRPMTVCRWLCRRQHQPQDLCHRDSQNTNCHTSSIKFLPSGALR